MMEKTLRVLGSEDGHSHSHSHGNSTSSQGHSTGVSAGTNVLRSRGGEKKTDDPTPGQGESGRGPSKLSAYLNLFGDFVHNMRVSFPCNDALKLTDYLAPMALRMFSLSLERA